MLVSVYVNNLSKQYKNKGLKNLISSIFCKKHKEEIFSISNISFEVEEGTILGIVGSNGAGKSTLFKLLQNSLHRDSGEIKILGVDNTSKEFLSIKENIGIIYDSINIPNYLSAVKLDNILSEIYSSWNSEKYMNLIQELNIPVNKSYRKLSRGNKMKLGFAMAFAHDTKVLLLDEATSGIDPILRNKILKMLVEFKNTGGTVIISSHVLVELETICDSILFVDDGRVILKDSIKCIQEGKYSETQLDKLFLKMVRGDVA